MTSYEVAKWLNEDASDKEFIEVFAYLVEASNCRGMHEKDRTEMQLRNQINIEDTVFSISNVIRDAYDKLK